MAVFDDGMGIFVANIDDIDCGYILEPPQMVGTRLNRLIEVLLTRVHNLCFE